MAKDMADTAGKPAVMREMLTLQNKIDGASVEEFCAQAKTLKVLQ